MHSFLVLEAVQMEVEVFLKQVETDLVVEGLLEQVEQMRGLFVAVRTAGKVEEWGIDEEEVDPPFVAEEHERCYPNSQKRGSAPIS